MFGLLDWVKIGAGGIAGAALIAAPVFFYGKSVGKADIVAKLKDDRIAIIQDGKKIDEDVLASDDAALCGLLGGCLPDEGPDEPL